MRQRSGAVQPHESSLCSMGYPLRVNGFLLRAARCLRENFPFPQWATNFVAREKLAHILSFDKMFFQLANWARIASEVPFWKLAASLCSEAKVCNCLREYHVESK